MESIQHYIQQLDSAEGENAYFRLIEAESVIVPELIAAYHLETNIQRRSQLVEIIGKHNHDSSMNFLSQALAVAEGEVWKTALDALVSINTKASLEVLLNERSRILTTSQDQKRTEWIEEAINQLQNS